MLFRFELKSCWLIIVLVTVQVTCFAIDEHGSCRQDDENILKEKFNLFPFIVLQPIIRVLNQARKEFINIWCEGIMISDIWGIAPPTCLITNHYWISLMEVNSTATHTYKASLKYFIPPNFRYLNQSKLYCDYIGLFILEDIRFHFKYIIELPAVHKEVELVEMNLYDPRDQPFECQIVGAQLLDNQYVGTSTSHEFQRTLRMGDSINLHVMPAEFISVQKYCNGKGEHCSKTWCRSFVDQISYVQVRNPHSPAESWCAYSEGYKFGTSLICRNRNRWNYFGLATNEHVISCSNYKTAQLSDGQVQAFTRVDFYLKWIREIIDQNGGINP